MIRIVKLHFKREHIPAFIQLFEERKERIASFPGCNKVSLLQDKNNEQIFFTYSYWEDDAALENYRTSLFFKETWQLTKALFEEKAAAWSVEPLYESM